nr:MAG TPA: hypothetical protein [Caudoviricetes sp.]
MNIGVFVWLVMAVFGVIGGIYQALVWFADEADRQCARKRERYTFK